MNAYGFEASASSSIAVTARMICLVVQKWDSSAVVADACDDSNSLLSRSGTFELQSLVSGTEYLVYATIITEFRTETSLEGVIVTLPYEPPSCISVVGNDPNKLDDTFAAGDTITLTFDRPTNGTSTMTSTDLESFTSFSVPIGASTKTLSGTEYGYEASWSADQTQLVITISDPGFANPMIGQLLVRVDGTAAHLYDAAGTSGPIFGECPYLTGGFGGPPPVVMTVPEDNLIRLVVPPSFAEAALNNPTTEYEVTFVVHDGESTEFTYNWLETNGGSAFVMPSPYPILDFVGVIAVDAQMRSKEADKTVESSIIMVQVTPVNDVPRINLQRSQLIWANGEYQTLFARASNGQREDIILDPDDAKVTASVQVYASGVFLRSGDPEECNTYDDSACLDPIKGSSFTSQCPVLCGLSEDTKSVLYHGTQEEVNEWLMKLQIQTKTLETFSIFIVARDNIANEESFKSFEIKAVCDAQTQPGLASAIFKPSLFGIDVVFDQVVYVLERTGAAGGDMPTCKTMFDANTVQTFGVGAKCVISKFAENTQGSDFELLMGFTEISITFGAYATLLPNDPIRTDGNSEILKCDGNSVGVVSETVELPPIEDLPLPRVEISTKTPSVGLCDAISISTRVVGAGPWPALYNWTEPTKQLFESISPTSSTVHFAAPGSTSNPEAEWPKQDGKYRVCVQASGQFTGLQSEPTCVDISSSTTEMPKMMAPTVPTLLTASCYDDSISLFLPHSACNNPTASLQYLWMVHRAGDAGNVVLDGPWASINNPRLSVKMDDLRSADAGLSEDYSIMLNVSTQGSSVANSLGVALRIICTPSIAIMGGSEAVLSRTRPVKLISVLNDDLVHNSEATFQWSCLQNSETCVAVNFKPLPMSNRPDLEIPAGMIGLGAYTFTVCANELIGRTACTTIAVRIVPDCLEMEMQLTARGQPADNIAEFWALSFNADVVGVNPDELEFEWDLGQFSALNGNCDSDDCLLHKNVYLPNSVDNPLFEPGTTLKFSVNVRHSSIYYEGGNSMTGYAAAEIHVPVGPSGGQVAMLSAEENGGVAEISTTGWGGGGAGITYHCFYVAGDVSPDHDPDDRVYLTLQPTVSTRFTSEFIPDGVVTLGVKAMNAYGSGFAYIVASNPENPDLAKQLSGRKDALLSDAARTGNVMPSFQLFSAFAALLKSGSGRRKRRADAGRNLANEESMLVSAMQFNIDFVESMGYAGSVQAQFQHLTTLKRSFTAIAESTKATAFLSTSALLADLYTNNGAPRIDLALAQRAVDVLVSLDYIVQVMTVIGDPKEDLNVQFEYAETTVNLLMATAKGLFGGADAPAAEGTIIPVSNALAHPSVWLTVARVEFGIFEGVAFTAQDPKTANNIGLLTLNEGCPLMNALGAPSMNGELLVHASMLAAFDSYDFTGGVVTSDPTTVRLDMELFPSSSPSRKLLCAHLVDGMWTTDGINTAIDSTNLALGCILPFNRSAGSAILCVFEDLRADPVQVDDDDDYIFVVVNVETTTVATKVATTALPDELPTAPAQENGGVDNGVLTWWIFGTVAVTAAVAAISIVVMAKRCARRRELENAEAYAAAVEKSTALPPVQVQQTRSISISSNSASWSMPERPAVSDSPFDLVTPDRPSTGRSMARPSKAWAMPERPNVGESPFSTEPVPAQRRRKREGKSNTSLPNTKGWSDFNSPGGNLPQTERSWAPAPRQNVSADPFGNNDDGDDDASEQVGFIEMDNLHNSARIETSLKMGRRQSNKALQQKLRDRTSDESDAISKPVFKTREEKE